MMNSTRFTQHNLNDQHVLYFGTMPSEWCADDDAFERWWALHPEAFGEVMIHGRLVKTPRWQKAFGHDYKFSGQKSIAAKPTPEMMVILRWCQAHIHPALNGLLLNWYDGDAQHYIGAHRDSTKNLVEETPIVTISLGATRRLRMRPYRSSGFEDFPLEHGDIVLIPWDTNQHHTHEIPKSVRETGRRVSITIRAFDEGEFNDVV